MKRGLVLAVVLYGLMLSAALVARSVVSGASRNALAGALSESLGVSVTFAASKLMSAPSLQLNTANARLQLGKGEWKGGAEWQRHGSATSGRSHGAVRNVDINELRSGATGMGSQTGGIPLPAAGAVESPRVRSIVGKMVSSAAGELLNSFFKKKTK